MINSIPHDVSYADKCRHLYEMPVKVGNAIFYRTLHLCEMPFVAARFYLVGNYPDRFNLSE